MNERPLDRVIADVARRQHGVFNRRQALAAGFTPRQIDRRASSERWIRLASGVYALPGNPATWHRQVMAAIVGERTAAASFGSAAVVQRIDGFRPGRPEITVPSHANHRSSLAIVHRSDRIATTKVDGIPVTTIEQTVTDLAATLGVIRLGEVIDSLTSANRTSIAKLSARHQAVRLPNRPGSRRLEKALIARSHDAWVPPSSVLEAALYTMLDDAGLPPVVRQPSFPWRAADPERLDTYIPRWLLFLEADGRTWHSRVADVERDRRRDHEVLAHGHRILRFGWEEIIEDPLYTLDTIRIVGAMCEQHCAAGG